MDLTCNCIAELETKVAARMSEKIGAPALATCEAVGFTIGGGIGMVHMTNFKVTSEKKGWARGKSVPVYASFCPFCGQAATAADAKKEIA